MAEPRIVFCNNNHIYDASLHKQCPYCKRIAQEQKELEDSIRSGFMRKRDTVISPMEMLDEDTTELITKKSDPESDCTELIRKKNASDEEDSTELIQKKTVSEEEDCTELIQKRTMTDEEDRTELIQKKKMSDEEDFTELIVRQKEETGCRELSAKGTNRADPINTVKNELINEGKVIGWLVFKNGEQAGHSIELCEKTSYLYEFEGKCLASSEINKELELLATVIKDGTLRIKPKSNLRLWVNGAERQECPYLRSYDEVQIEAYKMVFVELMTNFLGWR